MERQKGAQTLLIAVLAVAVLAMSIGFAAAAYNQNLTIGGNNDVTAKAAKWSVHYRANSYTETTGTGYVAASAHDLTNTAWTFTVTLEPGDTYEATAIVENDGTFDAKLTSITMSTLTTAQDAYLDWSVFVNGTEYQATTNNLNVALDKMNGSTPGTNNVKVVVKYIIPSDPSVLPSTDQTVTLSATLGYESVVQAGA